MNQYATHTWVQPGDGKTYVAVTTPQALFVVDAAADPPTARDLTSETIADSPDATAITGPSTAFTGSDGLSNIVGINDAGEIVRYYQTGDTSGGQAVWDFMNISTTQLTPNFIPTPSSLPISFPTSPTGAACTSRGSTPPARSTPCGGPPAPCTGPPTTSARSRIPRPSWSRSA